MPLVTGPSVCFPLAPGSGQVAFPVFLPGAVVSAISHDFKKRLGPQLCHGPSLVLWHWKHTHSLSPWTHVNMVVFSTGSLAWWYYPMKSVLYIFFTIGHTYTDVYIYLYKIILS